MRKCIVVILSIIGFFYFVLMLDDVTSEIEKLKAKKRQAEAKSVIDKPLQQETGILDRHYIRVK